MAAPFWRTGGISSGPEVGLAGGLETDCRVVAGDLLKRARRSPSKRRAGAVDPEAGAGACGTAPG